MKCRRGLAMRILSVRLSVCLSVCPSVCQTRALWQNGKNLCLDFYILRKYIYPSFLRRRMVGGGTPSAWNFGSTGPRWSEIADFEPIIARCASAVRPNEKSSINTNRKSHTRFPTSLRRSSYVAPNSPKGAQRRKSAVFPLNSHFSWRKSATKFLCVKTVSGKVVGHSLA